MALKDLINMIAGVACVLAFGVYVVTRLLYSFQAIVRMIRRDGEAALDHSLRKHDFWFNVAGGNALIWGLIYIVTR